MKKAQLLGSVLAASILTTQTGCVTDGTNPFAGMGGSSTTISNATGKAPTPTVSISDIEFVPSVSIAKNLMGEKLDVTNVDAFIAEASPNARHYPPNFPNKQQRYNTRTAIKHYVNWIDEHAMAPNASYDVLIRAAELNGMARNLDMGSEYAVRASNYVAKALKLKSTPEANTLYGFLLAEGGGFKEGQKYLDRAIALGSKEAIQSAAQTDLMRDRRSSALSRLKQLKLQHPVDPILDQQIAIIESGKYYIWDIPAPNINVKHIY